LTDSQHLITTILIGLGCFFPLMLANWLVPKLLPSIYDEERWTIGKHILQTLVVMFCITCFNQLALSLVNLLRPSFWVMYAYVTMIGFFPITLGLLVAERRRLKRNMAHAQTANQQLDKLHQPQPVTEMPEVVSLSSENGKEQLNLLPNQLIYIESMGNYVEVHWLNMMFPQKTVLRNTLKDLEAALQQHPQFLRCHRAFIINLKAVSRTEGNARGYQLTISGSEREIPVSRSYLDAFDTRMSQLVRG
jgi:hypothetical protein